MTRSKQQQQWVLLAQSGDRDALNALLESIQEPLFGYLRRLINDEHLARDALQEVLLLIARHLYWLREPTCFRAWAFRIGSREAFRTIQQEKRLPTQAMHNDFPDVVESASEVVSEEFVKRLPTLLATVSPASRAVLELHYLHEMTLQEVADVLEISLGTVKSRLAYGLAHLRRRLCSSS